MASHYTHRDHHYESGKCWTLYTTIHTLLAISHVTILPRSTVYRALQCVCYFLYQSLFVLCNLYFFSFICCFCCCFLLNIVSCARRLSTHCLIGLSLWFYIFHLSISFWTLLASAIRVSLTLYIYIVLYS